MFLNWNGITNEWKKMESKNHSGFYGGIILLLLGLFFLLDNLRILDFGYFIATFWPLILIFMGIRIIMKNGRQPRTEKKISVKEPESKAEIMGDHLSENNVFGDLKLDISSDKFHGGHVSNVFGRLDLDLSDCTLVDGYSRLTLNGVFGDISVYVPGGIGIKADCSAVAGEIRYEDDRREGIFPRLAYRDVDYAQHKKQLDIQAGLIFGSIVIRRK